jgi:hypothetical protein
VSQRYRIVVWLMFVSLCALTLPRLSALSAQARPERREVVSSPANALPFGYGLVMANALDYQSARDMGFNWIMVLDSTYQTYNPKTLRRVKVTYADLSNLSLFRGRVASAASIAEAVQIGNEPNLISEWGNEPDATQYRQLLCEAYDAIKQDFPSSHRGFRRVSAHRPGAGLVE